MLLNYLLLFLLSASQLTSGVSPHRSKTHDPPKCGNISIPYPFGIEDGGYFNKFGAGLTYKIACEDEKGTPYYDGSPLLNISVEDSTFLIASRVAYQCYDGTANTTDVIRQNLTMPEFLPSPTRNKFVAMGCDTQANIAGQRVKDNGNSNVHYATGCYSFCTSKTDITDGQCSGVGCCTTQIPDNITTYEVAAWSESKHAEVRWNPCSVAAVVDNKALNFSVENLTAYNESRLPDLRLPMVVDWWIIGGNCQRGNHLCVGKHANCKLHSKGYRCFCNKGWTGNPYHHKGCPDVKCSHEQDDNGRNCDLLILERLGTGACLLVIILLLGFLWWSKHHETKRLLELKERFFQRNGGFILSEKLDRRDISTHKFKIFTSDELARATNNYIESSIVGQGGFGTVYKGTLTDGEVVAIKKSSRVGSAQAHVEQFINEVLVLSEVNNKNIVKLLGCCLEAEVPLLVYEFIKNGTSYEHLHDPTRVAHLSWEIRLNIAESVASVLAYLHTTISIPIIHRDIKSMNILLDDNYTAKVSDFGDSKLGVMDHYQLATMVVGTWGYLDPEYMQTSELTEKSDVYSFGVVLVELLTGRKAISHDCPEDERSLAMHFLCKVKQDRLFDIVDAKIAKMETLDRIKGVANIAKHCLAVKGDERPTMKQVARELEAIKIIKKRLWSEDDAHVDECQSVLTETLLHSESSTSSTDSQTTSLSVLNKGR